MDLTPTAKIAAVGVAGAITTVLAFILSETIGLELPVEVSAAITTIITFGAGWLKRDATSPNP